MSVTLVEIAKQAGVDVSTVSRALNRRAGVRKEVRERVLEVARRLNYRPNLLARGLITGRTHSLGLLISDIRNPFFADFARGAEDAAGAASYDLVLCNSDMDPAKHMRYFRSLCDKRVDGIIMNSIAFLKRDDAKQLSASSTPVVLLNRMAGRHRFSTVLCDNLRGGTLAGEYLARLGHRKTAVLAGPGWHANLSDRAGGFAHAILASPRAQEPVVLRGEYNTAGGYEMTKKLLARTKGITAIFACSDAIAFGAIEAIEEAGLCIPGDISLIGFDDVEIARIVHPPLTTIRQPKYELGTAAVEILRRQAGAKGCLPEHRMFGVELVERQSCRAV
jgi:LacI family transcriptional regulator